MSELSTAEQTSRMDFEVSGDGSLGTAIDIPLTNGTVLFAGAYQNEWKIRVFSEDNEILVEVAQMPATATVTEVLTRMREYFNSLGVVTKKLEQPRVTHDRNVGCTDRGVIESDSCSRFFTGRSWS